MMRDESVSGMFETVSFILSGLVEGAEKTFVKILESSTQTMFWLFLSVWAGLSLLLLVFVAWKVIRILAELLALVRTIAEDVRDLRSHIQLPGSNSLPATEEDVKSLVVRTSNEDSQLSPGPESVSVLEPEVSVTADTDTLEHVEETEEEEEEDIEEVDREDEDDEDDEDAEKEQEELYKNLPIEPVIPLPEEVDTRTGEEEETVLYSHRAKLYRYTAGEWKDRGVGDIKILVKEGGRVRLLMRRERILNVSLNHCVSQDLVAQFRRQDERSWTWAAQDVSDGLQGREMDTFALKFKTPEVSEDFKKALDLAVTAAPVSSDYDGGEGELSQAGRELQLNTEVGEETSSVGQLSSRPLSELEKSSETSTTSEAESVRAESLKAASVVYQFGSTGAAPSPSTSPSKPETPKEPAGFSFKLPLMTAAVQDLTVETPDLSKEEKEEENEVIEATPTPLVSVPAAADLKKDQAAEEFEPDLEFQPVIALPELVETPTGEEGEDLLFSHRATLFRFVSESKAWKERGVGEFKILRHKETGKVRFLMRREQVLKTCCNHHLSPSTDFKPLASSDRAWQWTAPDFSEGEVVNELLAVRFKTVELASQWKKVVEDCQKKLAEPPVNRSQSKLQSGVAEVVPSLAGITEAQTQESSPAESRARLPSLLSRTPQPPQELQASDSPSTRHQNQAVAFSFNPEIVKTKGTESKAQIGPFCFSPLDTKNIFGSSTGSKVEAAATKPGEFSINQKGVGRDEAENSEKVKTVEVEKVGSLSSPGFRFSGVKTNTNTSQGLGLGQATSGDGARLTKSPVRKHPQSKPAFTFDWVGGSAGGNKATTPTPTSAAAKEIFSVGSPSSNTFNFSGVKNVSGQVEDLSQRRP